MKIDRGLPRKRDAAAEAVADAEAEADIEAGHGIEHAKVGEWLKTWGTPDKRPMPREWLE